MNIYSNASLIAFIVCFSLGSFVYFKGKKNTESRTFVFATVLTGTWCLFPFLASIARDEIQALFNTRTIYIAAVFTPSAWLHFMLTAIGMEEHRRKKNILIVSYSISILFLTVLFSPNFLKSVVRFAPHFAVIPGLFYSIFTLFFGVIFVYILYKIFDKCRNSSGFKRNQLKYICVAFGFGAVSGIMHFLAAYIGREPFPHDFLVILYPGLITYAIVAHHLMDINVVITRSVAYGGLTAIIAGAYIGLMAGVDRVFADIAGYNPTLAHALLFIVVFFALIYVLPQMKIRAIEITRRTLFRGKYDYQQELSEVARLIPTMLNLKQLGDYILTKLRDTLMVDKLAMLVYDEAAHSYSVLTSLGLDAETVSQIKIRENTALVGLLRDAAKPLVKEELKQQGTEPQEALPLAVSQLDALHAELCIPLMLKEDLSAIITLSHKKAGEMYTQEDLSLLSALANQVALAIEYIKAVDRLSSEKRYVGLGKAAMRMAHDIKNPLVPMKTFLQILPDKYPKEFAMMSKIDAEFTGRFYESALDGVDRINLLIERALHYARHPQPAFSQVEIKDILNVVLTEEEVDLKKVKVNLQKKYNPSADSLQADGEQLIELFSNLVSNSIDAMEESAERTLTVATRATEQQIVVEIGDTGCGIPKDKIDTIFDPFITYKHKGSGLGLAIAKKIVDDHKGTIEVSSEPGKGATFKVILPRKQQ